MEGVICAVCEREEAILDGLSPLKTKDWEEAVPYPVPLCRGCAEQIIYGLMHVWLTVRRRSNLYQSHRNYEQTRMLTHIRCSRCNKNRVIEDPYAFEFPEPIDQGRLWSEIPVEELEPELGGWLGLLEDDDDDVESG